MKIGTAATRIYRHRFLSPTPTKTIPTPVNIPAQNIHQKKGGKLSCLDAIVTKSITMA
jgi:hypothetical protein